MKTNCFPPIAAWIALTLLSVLPTAGCGKKELPLSPAAQAFKKDMKEEIDRTASLLAEPLAAGNVKAVEQAIEKAKEEMAKGGVKVIPFISALDKNGVAVAKDPSRKQTATFNYSTFTAMQEALSKKKATATRMYMGDGSRIFIVCAPIVGNKGPLGVLVFAFTDGEITQRLGLSEKDFLAINFNR